MLVLDVASRARQINADRVDLSATTIGQRLYEEVGSLLTSSARTKLVL
jgi:hypothetical protein